MPKDQPSLDLVVPCFQPQPGWEQNLVAKFREFQARLPEVSMALTLVNDGSDDSVSETHIRFLEAEIPNFHYLTYPENQGKGHALRIGVANSQNVLQLFTDIDFPYQIDSMVRVYEELAAGAEVVLGFREPDYYQRVPLFRKGLSKFLRWMLKRVLHLAITDTQCGLKAFNRRGKMVFLDTRIRRFLFDLEFVMMLARQPEISVRPVSVDLRDDVRFSQMNLRVLFREALNFLVLFFQR